MGAIQEATKAIALDPENGYAYYIRGFNRFDLQQYEESIEDLTKSLNLPYVYRSRTLNCRGWDYKSLGKKILSISI